MKFLGLGLLLLLHVVHVIADDGASTSAVLGTLCDITLGWFEGFSLLCNGISMGFDAESEKKTRNDYPSLRFVDDRQIFHKKEGESRVYEICGYMGKLLFKFEAIEVYGHYFTKDREGKSIECVQLRHVGDGDLYAFGGKAPDNEYVSVRRLEELGIFASYERHLFEATMEVSKNCSRDGGYSIDRTKINDRSSSCVNSFSWMKAEYDAKFEDDGFIIRRAKDRVHVFYKSLIKDFCKGALLYNVPWDKVARGDC